MEIKTSDFIPNLPPKDFNSLSEAEVAAGFDWLRILDSFDPSQLEQRYLNECARRNPCYTCYGCEADGIPHSPVASRLRYLESAVESSLDNRYNRRVVKNCIKLIGREGLNVSITTMQEHC